MRILQREFRDGDKFFSDPVRPNLLKSKMCSFFLDGLGAYIDPKRCETEIPTAGGGWWF